MPPPSPSTLPLLGWKEDGALPEWGIRRLRVKLDTGAKTSAIHVVSCEEFDGEQIDGVGPQPMVRLSIPMSRRAGGRVVVVRTAVVGRKIVRDSGGEAEERPVVRTHLRCGPIDRRIDVTVTDRAGMIFRMILGREALGGACWVDPAAAYTTRAEPRPARP